MTSEGQQTGTEHDAEGGLRQLSCLPPARSVSLALFAFLFGLASVPVASAHGSATAGLTQYHGAFAIGLGVVLISTTVLGKRSKFLTPTQALYGISVGLVVTAVGAILFESLAPDPVYAAGSMPFERSLYPLISIGVGLAITVGSLLVGWVRWPTRPRYTFLGIVLGLWISYPALVPNGYSHPLGYALVLGTPVLVGYILWTDARGALRAVLADPVSRRFGIGVGLLVGLFFLAVSGYLTVFLEEGAPHETTVSVLPVIYQLVSWPTLEVVLPHVPLFFAASIGVVVVVGTLSVLVGLNAAFVARSWRLEERTGGMAGSTAGTGAVVGSCTCGCCGPLVAKIAVLAAGPSIAAPLYWVFVDSASPLGSLFVVGSIVLFTASLVYSVETAGRPDRSASVVPAD